MGALNSLIKAGGKALSKTGKEVAKNAAEEATEKFTKEVAEKATQKAITDTARNVANKTVRELATGGSISSAAKLSDLVEGASLSGAGKSKLAKNSGSTLDGILGESSGISLPNAAKPKLSDYDLQISQLPETFSMKDLKKQGLSSKTGKKLRDVAEDGAEITGGVFDKTSYATKKSDLPILNRSQYYEETLGQVGKNGVRAADVPKEMQPYLSDKVGRRNDDVLRELFPNSDELSISELYDEYNKLVNAEAANNTFTKKNLEYGLGLLGDTDKGAVRKLDEDLYKDLYGSDIKVSGTPSKAQDINVSRAKAGSGLDNVAEATATTNPTFANEVAELKAQLGTAGGAGGAGNGGGTIAAATPDYGGLGESGYEVKLKNGETTNIKLQQGAVGSSKQQRGVRKLDDMTAKSMNPTNKQYKGLVGESGSIGGHYKTVAERMRAEKIDQANVADKAQAALSLREEIKRNGLQYAEENGVRMDLSGIDNTIGLSATQKRKLSELGLGLDDMLGGNKLVSPTQAEDIYKTLRDYAYNWSDSKDALTKMAGDACQKEAKAVREIIDNTMDNINVDYKTALIESASKNGEDPTYLRKLSGKSDFKFSDLRKDQSDWITINDLAGNKIKEDPTLNVFGVDTGIPNPLSAAADKVKEKYYQRQAGGAGVPPTGGAGAAASGAENNINFETVPAGQSKLRQLLGKGKTAGLVGAGVLGGMLLGGGGGGTQDQGDTETAGGSVGTGLDTTAGTTGLGTTETAVADPYSTITVGGYTYDELEQGYTNALMAGDTDAAKLILQMIDMWESKADRYEDALDSSSSSSSSSSGNIGSKQQAALNVLSGLMNNYQAQGPVGGRFTQFMNMLTGGGYNPGVSAYDSGSKGSLGTVIKALGDTGALSEGDQQRALELLPQTTDSEAAAKAKYQQLMQIIQGAGTQ